MFVLDEVDYLLLKGFEPQVSLLPSSAYQSGSYVLVDSVAGSKYCRVFTTVETEHDVLCHHSSSH